MICLAGMALAPLVLRAQNTSPAAEFGVEERVRSENWNNVFDYSRNTDDEREQVRFRTRFWAKIPFATNVDLNVGLNSESNYKFGQKNVFDEVMFDTANLAIRNLGVKGLSLKVGRQDISKGEGLILLEGTPGDGSRSLYFNAVDLSYAYRKSTIEAIGILNPRMDHFLPKFNSQNKTLVEWNDQALGLYYTDNNTADTTWEAYYFHKRETGDARAVTNYQHQADRRVETAGARLKRKINAQWSFTGEFARQWGSAHPGTPIGAWAAYGYATRNFKHAAKPYVTVGYWALSGDDPAKSGKISGWDPLFSRWPKWGDLELYSEAYEKGVGYATNQKRISLEGGFTPFNKATLKFMYYKVSAFHPFGFRPAVFGPGTDRGQNVQSRLDFQVNSYVRGHVDFETLLPGSFYAGKDRSYFLRFELIAQAKALVHIRD
jgi:hypothetical protein